MIVVMTCSYKNILRVFFRLRLSWRKSWDLGGVSDSRVRFLWVSRGTRESRLKEAIKGSLGVVVSWWDQLRMLCYAAIGGFWTHCGIGMRMESKKSTTELLARRDEVKELVKRFMDGED
ncbi:hypothetical protein IGI04_016325 [Brassica rapa subsp. trilocularis]|uniref:Transmembrane protein n=1 Tax=Brassica rapa subsp. trilocularis TaxID=1813537 RepID=A0ABQ7MSL8_BRACM|nr:hypothetical protein IGI04_016325 [Brassica rapa subsp. trilocularis]